MSYSDKLIINVALTGMIPQKEDNYAVPISPDEIADDIKRCYELGATIFHVHARTTEGLATHKIDKFREIAEKIKSSCPEAIFCVTTSGRLYNEFEKRSQVLDLPDPLKPDMASLTLGSMNFAQQASINTPQMIQSLLKKMNDRKICPELEVFDMGMIDYAKFLIKSELLKEPLYFNLLLGSLGTIQATSFNLAIMVNSLPEGSTWAATGLGKSQYKINALAITMGGHVRVGLEDSLYMGVDKSNLATNPRLVERLVQLARIVGRDPASPEETRKIIGLQRV